MHIVLSDEDILVVEVIRNRCVAQCGFRIGRIGHREGLRRWLDDLGRELIGNRDLGRQRDATAAVGDRDRELVESLEIRIPRLI